jgi:hypothetical protein
MTGKSCKERSNDERNFNYLEAVVASRKAGAPVQPAILFLANTEKCGCIPSCIDTRAAERL